MSARHSRACLRRTEAERSRSDPLRVLSRREMEVMLLLAEGRSSDEVGIYLAISPKTVASYKQGIQEKLKT